MAGWRVFGDPTPYGEYVERRYFTPLDGLRAVSILLVISVHTTDPLFDPLHGNVGVTIFFVISGYLITTLLLREEKKKGKARIGAFYIRRAFRLLPLYYVTLFGYMVLVGILHLQPGSASFWRGMPWYATYQNDFAHEGVFGHTWSLAVEEKFYLLWPLAFSVLFLRRNRLAAAVALSVVTAALAATQGPPRYFAQYAPILFGCVAALVLDNPRLYRHAQKLANTPVAIAIVVTLVVYGLKFENGALPAVHIFFGLLTALLLPAVLIGPRWFSAVLSNRVALYIGTRAYAIYLIHRMVKAVIDRRVAPGSDSVPHELLHYVLIVVGSVAAAEVLGRLIERPLIGVGRRLSERSRKPSSSLIDAGGEVESSRQFQQPT